MLWVMPRSLTLLVLPLWGIVVGCAASESASDLDVADMGDMVDIVTAPPRGETTTPSSDVTTAAVEQTTSSTPSTASTMSPAPTAPSDGRLDALDVLTTIPVRREVGAGYDRDLFGGWIDADGDGCNTREEVLIRDSRGFAQVDPFGCTVVAGDWVSSYDGLAWSDPSDVDIDHVVALKEAWDSGANAWSDRRRRAFANDLSDVRSLRAVTDSVNRSKGDRDPSQWMPPQRSQWCGYLADWVAIKARWGLSMDESEAGRIRRLLAGDCAGARLASWAPAPGG